MKQVKRLDINDIAKRLSTKEKKVTKSQIKSRLHRSKHLVPPPIPCSRPLAWDAEVVYKWEKGERFFYGQYWGIERNDKKEKSKQKNYGKLIESLKGYV